MNCANDDDSSDPTNPDNFYSGALTSATESDLLGTWAIFSAVYDGVFVDIPANIQECGRDFFIYSENNIYREYFYQSSECDYLTSELNWELEGGVLTLTNSIGQSDELVITTLNSNEFKFKAKFDIDEDGELDVFTINARRYVPQEVDTVSPTFIWNSEDENLISFTWDTYQGINEFDRYEIYRSFGEGCTKDNAILVQTITDVSTTEFSDLTPPGEQILCYYIKIYTNQGQLGESYLHQLYTNNLFTKPVTLFDPTVVNDQIHLSWDVSEMSYFSHYEITFSNYPGNITGYGKQEIIVAQINDINTISFVDENPPYLENPYYNIYVYDIFGNKTYPTNQDVTTFREVNFKRNEIIDFQDIKSYAMDADEPVMYFYGRETGDSYNINIHRFNYESIQTEAVANLSPTTSTGIPIKVIQSNANGKELVIEQGSDFSMYDANTLEYKYEIESGVLGVDDFIYTSSGYWVIVDHDDIYSFVRDNANFTMVDSKPHFTDHQGTFNYQVFELDDNKLLVGHKNEPHSMVFNIDVSGIITYDQTVPIPILDSGYNRTKYNSQQDYIVNFDENRLYSTNTYSFLESFEEPYFPSGISENGISIFGTNNDPDWQITQESLHAKEAIKYDRNISSLENYNTIGYPHVIFENHLGDIISISSGLKKEGLDDNINNKGDIFLEKINIP
jgi:hypothetical protein